MAKDIQSLRSSTSSTLQVLKLDLNGNEVAASYIEEVEKFPDDLGFSQKLKVMKVGIEVKSSGKAEIHGLNTVDGQNRADLHILRCLG